jgi:uncharacterized protein
LENPFAESRRPYQIGGVPTQKGESLFFNRLTIFMATGLRTIILFNMEIRKRPAICPSCGTRYRVPENALHKVAPCLKCGQKFKIVFEDEPLSAPPPVKTVESPATDPSKEAEPQEPNIAEPASFGLQLVISEDRFDARLFPPVPLPDSLTLESLKEYISQKGIVYGLVEDDDLTTIFTSQEPKEEGWIVARGTPPQSGEDANLIYHFDHEGQKAGTVREDGIIDFKDKGEIQQVKEGDLLAEKKPLIKEVPGKDVFGKMIPQDKARDVLLLAGENTKVSEDGLKIFAKTGGRPALIKDGRISVYPELRIEGDVGLETGHIQFNGHINVRGIIQEGFRVKGGQLTAMEINKAEVDIEGDIDIQGGIIGSKIKSNGNIKARYIEASTIRALGDISVRDELLHGDIEINGLFSMSSPAGKIISSTISARKGVEAAVIGSGASRPCTLIIGVDSQAKELSERFGLEIERRKNEQEAFRKEIEKLKRESKNYDGRIAHLAQVQDRGILEQKTLKAQKEELEQKNDLAHLSQVEWEYSNLQSKIKAAEDSLNQLMGQQDQVTETILARQRGIKEQEQAIQGLNDLIEKTKEEANRENLKPFIKVLQVIHSGTLIKGKQASLVLHADFKRVQFTERMATGVDESGQTLTLWEIAMAEIG